MKRLTKRRVAPDYHRIPHLNKSISNMTHDDIVPDLPIDLPLTCFVQEKIDGAKCYVITSFNLFYLMTRI